MAAQARRLDDIRRTLPRTAIFRGQAQHAMLAVLLVAGALSLIGDGGADGGASGGMGSVGLAGLGAGSGSLWGMDALGWARLTIRAALIHQVMVAIIWRLQLHFALMSRLFGRRALAVWGAMFLPFLAARPILLLLAGLADQGSLGGSRALQAALGLALLVPAIWGAHSVAKYFTIPRALGGDHFEDRYLNMPLVREGIFRYTPNAMYGVVFLGLWGIALLCGSRVALVLALFQHAYIWVHMYCTETPDMEVLYKRP